MSALYVPGHLLDAKDPVVNKTRNSPSHQGANDLVRIKDTELLTSRVMDITKGEKREWGVPANLGIKVRFLQEFQQRCE